MEEIAPAADLGLVGLGVMGRNLALNLAEHGYSLALHDQLPAPLVACGSAVGDAGGRATACSDAPALVAALKRPRTILLLVPAGAAVDQQIASLAPLLDSGDILIDAGNSWYRDTMRRATALAERQVHLVDAGVSGGAAGARSGPAIMAGGTAATLDRVDALFRRIAAIVDGQPCRARLAGHGAGHFAKTVHNGIEYAAMQLIAEAWHLLRRLSGLAAPAAAQVFAAWNQGPLESYLMGCAATVLGRTDEATGRPLLDLVADRSEHKGTGQWAAAAALELGVPVPTIIAAVQARQLSGLARQRAWLTARPPAAASPFRGDPAVFADDLAAALEAALLTAYAQGFALLQAAATAHGWTVDLPALALSWRGGCIIRARLLDRLAAALARRPEDGNLLCDDAIAGSLEAGDGPLRRVVAAAVGAAEPVPALASAIAHLDAFRSPRLWTAMVAAQRDAFGAHGYGRIDRPGRFHTDWSHP